MDQIKEEATGSNLDQNCRNHEKRRRLFLPAVTICMVAFISVQSIEGSLHMTKVLKASYASCGVPSNAVDAATMGEGDTNKATIPQKKRSAVQSWVLGPENGSCVDVAVPTMGKDDKLIDFARDLGTAIQEFHSHVQSNEPVHFRLLVTRYPSDDSSPEFHQELSKLVSLSQDSVVFVKTAAARFHRAHAINVLQAHASDDTKVVFTILDVDIRVGPRFLYNILRLVDSKTAYFPIVFSEFRPSSVLLVEKFLGPQSNFSENRGLWRDFGYGMYAIPGNATKFLQLDETFKGWGGEDVNFFGRVQAQFRIVRKREHDLIHKWHPKYCDLGSFVEGTHYTQCLGSRDKMEGSSFGLFLLNLWKTEPANFYKMIQSSNDGRRLDEILALAEKEYEVAERP